jgi:hypothetical protein
MAPVSGEHVGSLAMSEAGAGDDDPHAQITIIDQGFSSNR